MKIISTEKQKENFAKYLYDISKITFAVVVVGPFAKPEIVDKITFSIGALLTIIFFIFAAMLDSTKIKS